jgi:hypothetical protein
VYGRSRQHLSAIYVLLKIALLESTLDIGNPKAHKIANTAVYDKLI